MQSITFNLSEPGQVSIFANLIAELQNNAAYFELDGSCHGRQVTIYFKKTS